MITVFVEPDNQTLTFPQLNTVLMLQKRLGLRVNDALIIRGPELLTPDRKINDGDEIRVRKVMSTG
jgi:sulfur carrier protein